MTGQEYDALNDALNRIHSDVRELRQDVKEMATTVSDVRELKQDVKEMATTIAQFRGETVGVQSCRDCQGRWVDKKYFTGVVATLVIVMPIIMLLLGKVI